LEIFKNNQFLWGFRILLERNRMGRNGIDGSRASDSEGII
jgi:hypothetical protein